MRKIIKIAAVISVYIFGSVVFSQRSYADLIAPGQTGNSGPSLSVVRFDLMIGTAVGIVTILAVTVAIVVLIKIRRKKMKK